MSYVVAFQFCLILNPNLQKTTNPVCEKLKRDFFLLIRISRVEANCMKQNAARQKSHVSNIFDASLHNIFSISVDMYTL